MEPRFHPSSAKYCSPSKSGSCGALQKDRDSKRALQQGTGKRSDGHARTRAILQIFAPARESFLFASRDKKSRSYHEDACLYVVR
eukprot:scaffold6122_cov167-Skeletonema_marinoi.AAC.3